MCTYAHTSVIYALLAATLLPILCASFAKVKTRFDQKNSDLRAALATGAELHFYVGVQAGVYDTTPKFLTLPIFGDVLLNSGEIYKSVEAAPDPNLLLKRSGQ